MAKKKLKVAQQDWLPISEQVRNCLKDCGQTRYAVSKATGISEAVLSRFANGKVQGLSARALNVLGKYLRLEVLSHGILDGDASL
ncbi:MAG: helix-turn-helix transcriptional regulator [Planctomycetia bacterium]|nr:helix-turn-helix transcriptional regulator [Planctomycetia bacterium]